VPTAPAKETESSPPPVVAVLEVLELEGVSPALALLLLLLPHPARVTAAATRPAARRRRLGRMRTESPSEYVRTRERSP
jgi:hypothetical protein